jgi:hypothetical protein
MNTDLQRWFAWTGIPSMVLFFIGMVVMTFIPPLSPALSANEVASIYQNNTTGIRIGAVMILISSMVAIPFYGAVSIQLRAMEGDKRPVAAYAQLAAGAANIQFFILPALLFVIASFRPERSPELTSLLNDLAWIITILPWPITGAQMLICGVAILKHSSHSKVFPRWVGFLNLWLLLLMVPGSLIPFFKTGPFAWNGLLAFWIPATMFGIWFIVMQVMVLKAIDAEKE